MRIERVVLAVLTVLAVVLLAGAVGNIVGDAVSERAGQRASLAVVVVLGAMAAFIWWRVERRGKALK